MAKQQTILVVDDDEFMRLLIAEAINDKFRILDADSGKCCLELAASEQPDAILLDVEMQGLDGYETCRLLKNEPELCNIPVIFVSSHDQISARLRGYEAGADDYIVKPFDPPELIAKISALMDKVSAQSHLKEMASSASRTAMTAMSNVSEMGTLLKRLQSLNACRNFSELAEAAISALASYDLQGVVQVRGPDGALTRTSHGPATPLEASVIGHMAGMERMVQFRNRLSITYPQISLLVSNMPQDDNDRCGRLRDHLSVLIESAEVRAANLSADHNALRRANIIAASVKRITEALAEIDYDQRHSRIATGIAIQDLTTSLEHAYAKILLTETQEETLARVANEGVARVLDAQLAETSQQDKMTTIIRDLQNMLAA
ncbi:MAG: response regulator [Zoogloeaceae bacterium]|nr:response regulator [Zoogloeaceae bacterium]